ncbi:hypothetical protein [Phenylobacterium sp.]|uniref:hypothetical protein n=1 Tax=Phenylobacterium sp. TaxID=1871053 RepID=UPI0025D2A28E|nr:hypothetical protein [Phenylobacterium sp.]
MLLALGLACAAGRAAAQPLTLWAWERPEDLRFAPADADIAVQTGFIELSGERLIVRGRRHPLAAPADRVTTAVVHVQVDPRRELAWRSERAEQVAAAVLRLGARPGVRRLQVDFEVRASQRPILLALLQAVRAGLPAGTTLSMTALASWCETEGWLADAPVDEVVPMLFRMGPGGGRLKAKLAAGGDFADPRCRSALAISTDTPVRAPAGRRVYLFSPRSWTASDFERVKERVATWRGD